MKQVKLNVLADFLICTIITTLLTNKILKDAISDLTTARIFKDVCVASQNVLTGKVFTSPFSRILDSSKNFQISKLFQSTLCQEFF